MSEIGFEMDYIFAQLRKENFTGFKKSDVK